MWKKLSGKLVFLLLFCVSYPWEIFNRKKDWQGWQSESASLTCFWLCYRHTCRVIFASVEKNPLKTKKAYYHNVISKNSFWCWFNLITNKKTTYIHYLAQRMILLKAFHVVDMSHFGLTDIRYWSMIHNSFDIC